MSLRSVEPPADVVLPVRTRSSARLEPTADVLARLPRYTWTVLHDVAWPGREGQVVDHVVIGPAGIFVVDLRHWDGPIALDEGILRAEDRPREREVAEAADAALDVASVLDRIDPHWVVPVICLVRDEPVAGMTRGVVFCSSGSLEQMITSRREVISPDRARFLAQLLQIKLTRGPDAVPVVPDPVVTAVPHPRRRRPLPDGMGTIVVRAALVGVAVAALVGDPSLITHGADALRSFLTVR